MPRAILPALLMVTTLCLPGAHAAAEGLATVVETEAAMVLDPPQPRAGAELRVRLAQDLITPGRTLELRDGDHDRVLETRVLGRHGLDEFLFKLPDDLRSLQLRLLDGDLERLRWPASTPLIVATPGIDGAGEDRPVATLDGTRAQGTVSIDTLDCRGLPPTEDAGHGELVAWLGACPLDSALLRERDLRGLDLSGRDLHRADLAGADLADANLAGADLGGATLLGARLDGADFSGANLEFADLGHASLFVTDFAAANLRGADLRRVTATSTSFANADLTGARLAGAELDDVDFTGAVCPDGMRTLSRCDAHLELP